MDVAGGISLVQTILQLLDSDVWKETQSVLGVKSQLERLKKTMSTIDAILRVAEEQERLHHRCPSYDERDKLERLKEALYQADDLVDEVTTVAQLKKLIPGNKLRKKVSLFFSQFNQLRSAVTWSQEIKSIRERLDDVVKDHQLAGGFRHSVILEDSRVRYNPRETHSYVDLENDVIIGRDDDRRVLIDMLLDTTVEGNVSVVTVVGIGGLGKTTLAQLVYNDDENVQKEFTLKMWVCVSDEFDFRVLTGQILAAANPEVEQDGKSLDHLQTKLRHELDGKKYLLVLDDLWNEDPCKWLELRKLLVGCNRGSKILVTTRSKKVADVVGSCRTRELKGLSDNDSLTLLQKMALRPEEHPMKPQLVDIGKEIVRKCANVPLAIRVVGSFLRGQGENKWENLKNTDLANIKQDEKNGILPVLKISYNYLPFHLKRCFSYCAVFPKDYKIVKDDLIRLWMAQGFIMLSIGENLEDVGEEYFKQLLQRCFFQDVEKAKYTADEIISCKMHDLVYDLAKEVAGPEILSCNNSIRCCTEKARHVFLDSSTEDNFDNLVLMKRTRTFLCDNESFSYDTSLAEKILKLKCLRALCCSLQYENDFGRRKLTVSAIGELLHLRYLDLSNNRDFRVLPSSITNLYNLQTLKLCKCNRLKRLPRDLRKLVNLRHLDIYGCSRLTCMPPGMGSMTSLQNLTRYVVGGTSNNVRGRGSASVGELVNLETLTSHSEYLEIVVRKGVRYNDVEASEEGLLCKSQRLREIQYLWNTSEYDGSDNGTEALLQSLRPHSYLRKLELWKYPGLRLPFWMMNLKTCLPNLVEIEIRECSRLEQLPLMSQLRHLKFLKLEDLSEVENMESNNNSGDEDGDELVCFPSLEKLYLRNMSKLNRLWMPKSESEQNEAAQAPKLSHLHLEIYLCPNLTTLFPYPEFNATLGSSIMNPKTCLSNVVEIVITKCSGLEHLSLISQLLHLKVLTLHDLGEVEYMENNNNNSGDEDGDDELVFFPSLKKMMLRNMPKLKGWWKWSSESRKGETREAAVLSELVIRDCPELTTFPLCPKLETLELSNYNEALGPIIRETTHDMSSSSSICNNNNNNGQKNKQQHQEEGQQGGRLREVKIDNVGYLNSPPFHSYLHFTLLLCQSGRLSSLRSLVIEYCCNLKSISAGRGVWEHFTALQSLSLKFLPELNLDDEDDVTGNSSSNEITEEGSSAAEMMPWRYLAPTLRSLAFCGLPKMVKLPKGIECLSSLQNLNIWGCDNLESLTPSLGRLSSLQSLTIAICPELITLPEEMRLLTSLTKLHIYACSPELKNECKNKNGANWFNIQHIPNIVINHHKI